MQEVLSQQLKCKLFHCLIGFISTDWAVEITPGAVHFSFLVLALNVLNVHEMKNVLLLVQNEERGREMCSFDGDPILLCIPGISIRYANRS